MTEWPEARLADVAEIRVSNVDKKTIPGEVPARLCNYMDVYGNGGYVTSDLPFMEASASTVEIERFRVECGDVLLTKDSETPDDIGIPAVVVDEIQNLVCGYHLALIKPNSEQIDSVYLAKQLGSNVTARYFSRLANGSTRYGLSSSSIACTLIPLAPLPQQRRIAEILSTVDEAIEQTEALIAKYQQIKAGLLHDLFTRGVTPDGHLRPTRTQAPHLYRESPLGCIPKAWECRPAETLLERIIDYRGKTPVKTVAGIPLITAKNVRMGYIDPEPREFIAEGDYAYWMTRGIPNLGDVLFTTEAPLGNVAQIETTERVAFAQRVIILQPSPKIRSGFLMAALTSERMQRAIARLSSGTTALGIKQSEFRKVLLSHPSDTKEQELVEAKLESMDGYIQGQQKVMGKLLQEKHGLMHDLLAGRVRVKVAETEVPV